MFHVPAHKHVGPNGPGQIVNPIPQPAHQVSAPSADFVFANHGSVCTLTPISQFGEEWIEEHVGDDALTWGRGIVVEPRYADVILDAINADGLEVV